MALRTIGSSSTTRICGMPSPELDVPGDRSPMFCSFHHPRRRLEVGKRVSAKSQRAALKARADETIRPLRCRAYKVGHGDVNDHELESRTLEGIAPAGGRHLRP